MKKEKPKKETNLIEEFRKITYSNEFSSLVEKMAESSENVYYAAQLLSDKDPKIRFRTSLNFLNFVKKKKGDISPAASALADTFTLPDSEMHTPATRIYCLSTYFQAIKNGFSEIPNIEKAIATKNEVAKLYTAYLQTAYCLREGEVDRIDELLKHSDKDVRSGIFWALRESEWSGRDISPLSQTLVDLLSKEEYKKEGPDTSNLLDTLKKIADENPDYEYLRELVYEEKVG